MPNSRNISARQDVARKFSFARLEAGLSQEELAEMLGTKRSNISRMESGAQNLTIDSMVKMAGALGKDVKISLEEPRGIINDTYSLRLYDYELISFKLEEKGLEGLKAHILDVNASAENLFPMDLEVSDEGVVKWLERRVIPKNRHFVDEILKTLGLSANNTKGIIDVCKGLSLTDSYWVIPIDFTGMFSEFNLFENRFSEVLSLVAYTGVGRSNPAFTTSPELTTNGMLPKCWRFVDGDGIYLYKGGTSRAANTGLEPYSEYYASQIAEAMDIFCVRYELENWKGILASKCRLFTDIDHSFVPAGSLVKNATLKSCLDAYQQLGKGFYEHLCSMIVFDAVVYNEDRHFGNFGLIRYNSNGKIMSPAPIFDNGISLFNYAMPDDFENIAEYANTRSNPYRVSYDDICAEIMTSKQKSQLRKLIGFKFSRHPSINLPEDRLVAIEKQIQVRVRQLLAL